MKHLNLKKAVEKFAKIEQYEHGKCPAYRAKCNGYIISWHIPYYTPDEASCVRVYHENDKDDICSDYFAGSFYDTIKSAVNALTYNLRKGEILYD